MSRGVQPKKVSPLIKGARYSFLIAGWFYGASKKAVFRKIEESERPKRKAINEAEEKHKIIAGKERSKDELRKLFKDIGFEPEPGWEDIV